MGRQRKFKYVKGEKLFSRKLGWYLGSFVKTSVMEDGQKIHMVKMREPRPVWAGFWIDGSDGQGYREMMIGNEAEIRRQGLEPLMHGKHERRDDFSPGKAVAFDRDGYVFPGPFHPEHGETNCEGVIARDIDPVRDIRKYLVLVKPEHIKSVIAKLRARAEAATRINPGISLTRDRNDESLNGLPTDIFIHKSSSGYWEVQAPEDGECGGYLFRPLMQY